VLAKQAQSLDTETFALDFDPRVIEFRDAAQGEVLGAEAGKAAVAVTPHTTDGTIELRLHRSTSATKEEGRLLRLTFLAKAPGVSTVHLSEAKRAGVDVSDDAVEARGVVRVR
jgi:general secretion pathway protein D